MKKIEKLTRSIIELIHNKPYNEAREIEGFIETNGIFGSHKIYARKPITIGIVLQAIKNKFSPINIFPKISFLHSNYIYDLYIEYKRYEYYKWKLINDNGEEATLNDQDQDTIDSLYKLFNN
jgi:hypothetical protein